MKNFAHDSLQSILEIINLFCVSPCLKNEFLGYNIRWVLHHTIILTMQYASIWSAFYLWPFYDGDDESYFSVIISQFNGGSCRLCSHLKIENDNNNLKEVNADFFA